MDVKPTIELLHGDVGSHPEIRSLNPRFEKGVPVLKLTLDLEWAPDEPSRSYEALEARMAELCPTLSHHECRGDGDYEVLAAPRRTGGGNGDPRGGFEAALALAHLFEHAMIDAVAFVTEARTVSGATGAHAETRRRFDVFVECPAPEIGPAIVHVVLAWIAALSSGTPLNGNGRGLLEVVRRLHRRAERGLGVAATARDLALSPAVVSRFLGGLEEEGVVRRVTHNLNFSGDVFYRPEPGARWRAGALRAH